MAIKLPPNVVFYAVMGVGFSAWIIVLGGVGAVTKDCATNLTFLNCLSSLQNKWWAVWFEFFVLAGFAGLHIFQLLCPSASAMLAFLAIVTAVLMQAATDIMMTTVITSPLVTSELQAAAAGYVMLCLVNFVIIILIGSDQGIGYLGTFGALTKKVSPLMVATTTTTTHPTKAHDSPAETPRSDDSGHEAAMV